MQLMYRGVGFESQPLAVATQGIQTGIYRGQDCSFGIADLPADLIPSGFNWVYRGVPVMLAPATPEAVLSVSAPTVVSASVLSHGQRKLLQLELDSIHRANLVKRLDTRLRAAQQRGDVSLVRILEAEQKQMA